MSVTSYWLLKRTSERLVCQRTSGGSDSGSSCVHPSAYLSNQLTIQLTTHSPIFPPLHSPIHLPAHPPIYHNPSTHQSTHYPSTYPSSHPVIHPPTYLFTYLFICPPIHHPFRYSSLFLQQLAEYQALSYKVAIQQETHIVPDLMTSYGTRFKEDTDK